MEISENMGITPTSASSSSTGWSKKEVNYFKGIGTNQKCLVDVANKIEIVKDRVNVEYCMFTFIVFEKNRFKHTMVHQIQGHSMNNNIIFHKFMK